MRKACEALKSEGPQTQAERREKAHETNVVRLPRDWLGPREELVPFGPRADAAGATAQAAGRAAHADAADSSAQPPSAQDFWTEQAVDLHDALQGPGPSVERSSDQASSSSPLRVRRPWPRGLRFDRRVVGPIALAALAAVVGAIVLTGWSSGPGAPRHAARAGQSASASAALVANTARRRRALARQSSSARRVAERHRTPARAHHPRARSSVHGAAVSHSSRPAAPSYAISHGTQSGSGAAQIQAPASAAPPSRSAPPAASSAASDQGSSSAATHPYGLGGTVGPGHSPNG
jgi:hypothetical protein